MGTGYTRQSTAAIVDGNTIDAPDIAAEFNQLEAAFSGTSGHAHDGTLGEGPPINLTTSVVGLLPITSGGTGADTAQGALDALFLDGKNVSDAYFYIAHQEDDTKRIKFNLANIATATDRTITLPNSDITITPFGAEILNDADAAAVRTTLGITLGTDVQPFNANLAAIAALSGTGFLVRTGTDTWALRNWTGTSNQVVITNGDGIAGNPTIALSPNVTISGTFTAATLVGAVAASQITGVIPNARISGSYTGFSSITASSTVTANAFVGNGSGVTNLNASNLSSGTVPNARVSGAYDGFTNITASGNVSAASFTGDGSGLTGIGGAYVPTGSIFDFAGANAPSGYLLCYGQEVSRTQYADLFAVIGTTFGSGNGSTTFNVPDARGRVSAGRDNMGGTSANRLSTINGNTLGSTGGAQEHTLLETQMAAHTHGTGSLSVAAHSHSAGSLLAPNHNHQWFDTLNGTDDTTLTLSSGTRGRSYNSNGSQTLLTGISSTRLVGQYYTTTPSTILSGGMAVTGNTGNATAGITGNTASAGGNQAHNNVQPTIIFNKIIKT